MAYDKYEESEDIIDWDWVSNQSFMLGIKLQKAKKSRS